MRTAICLVGVFSVLIALAALPARSDAVPAGYKLVWSDEFHGPVGSQPTTAVWSYQNGPGYGQEVYVGNQADCHIVADPQATDHRALQITGTPAGPGKYQSAQINTEGKYSVQYGYIEARMKIPGGQGMWPAFWMLGNNSSVVHWPACGEIDIMENVGKTPATVYGSVHGPGYINGNGTTAYTPPDKTPLSTGYHTYAILWKPGAITFYLDGKPYVTDSQTTLPKGSPWVFDSQPFYLILDLAIGGNWPGSPDATTHFPAHLLVDYVRVYEPAK